MINGGRGAGGGGRVAIVLTAGNASELATLTAITAYGGSNTGGAEYVGAAGTVYLRGADQNYGTLVVDNNNLVSGTYNRTLINVDPHMTDETVGGVVLRNRGYLSLVATRTLTVYGSWSNAATFAAASGSTVVLAGVGAPTNTVSGNTTFTRLICQAPGMTLKFQAGGSNAVSEAIVWTGAAGSNLILRSTASPTQWKLNVMASATKTFRYLDVQDSDARPGVAVSAIDSVNGGNNSNWIFVVAGLTNTWLGGTSQLWTDGGNWSLSHAPIPEDARVVIPSGCPNYPYLTGPVTINELDLQAGSLRTSNQVLTVNGAAWIGGTLIAAGSETVTFNSNLTFTAGGAFTPARNTVQLGGTAPQTLTTLGNAFYTLAIANTNSVTFADGFTVTNLTATLAGGGTLNFTAGQTYTVNNRLVLAGSAPTPILMNAAAGSWNLNVNGLTVVKNVTVKNSNAAGGRTIYAFNSTDQGGNPNWNFGLSKLWVGTSTSWTTAGNWSPAGVPGITNHVLIDGTVAVMAQVSAATSIAGLTLAGLYGPASLSVDMPFAGGFLTATGHVDIGANSLVTHAANGSTEVYRLALAAGGDLTIAAGGVLDVSGRGFGMIDNNYGNGYGPGGTFTGGTYGQYTAGASHGGLGGDGYEGSQSLVTYGSVTNPVRAGSSTRCAAGGGVAILRVTGTFTHNGSIAANGNLGNHGAAGGSVNITAGHIGGTGAIAANGGDTGSQGSRGAGAGGRVAIALTAGNASEFAPLSVGAKGGAAFDPGAAAQGAAGTVYLQTAAQGSGKGTVTINNNARTTTKSTQIPPTLSPILGELRYASIIVTNRGAMAVTVSDRIQSLTVATLNEPLNLGTNGTVLTLNSMTITNITYTKGGLYTTNNWNGYSKPTNVSGAGAIEIRSKGTLLMLR